MRRVPSIRIGSSAASSNIFVCGKLKPSGSFHGPCTSHDTRELRDVDEHQRHRISLALNLVLSSAGIAAHSAPPIAPATTIVGSSSGLAARPRSASATPPPATAPVDELALGADVPDVGAKADGEADGDQHQRRRLEQELGDAVDPHRAQEEDAEALDRILAERGEDDRARRRASARPRSAATQ